MRIKEYVADKFENIAEWIKNYFYYKPRSFLRYLRNLPSIIIITWETNFVSDYSSVIYVMEWKLKQLRDHMEEHKFSVGYEQRVAEIDKVLEHIEFASGEKELPEITDARKKHRDFFGKIGFRMVPDETKLNVGGSIFIAYDKDLTEEEKELEGKNRNEIHQLEERLQTEHWEKAFELMKNNLRTWWC